MAIELNELFKLVIFTSGRRIFAFRKVYKVADKLGEVELMKRLEGALQDDRETRALDNRWAGHTNKSKYVLDVPVIDNWVDQLLTSLRDTAANFTKPSFAGTELEATARRFLKQAFPHGVGAITSLPYVDQVAAVEVLLTQLRGPLAADAAVLGMTKLIDRLVELTVQYRQAVDRDNERLEFATVKAARQRGQNNLLEIIAMIVGRYPSSTDPEQIDRRTALLEPILAQDRAIRAIFSARRSVPDVDPDADADGDAPGDADSPGDAGGDAGDDVGDDADA